ncbi:MAG: pilus assembly protein [Gemmataceae bacterium]|nr:pilus assembly protein [Gemmataceae bacterium]
MILFQSTRHYPLIKGCFPLLLLSSNINGKRIGAAMVEMAVVLVVFLTMFMGIIEYGRYYYLVQVANNAVRDGARYAVVHTGDGTTATQVSAVVTTKMNGTQNMLSGYTVSVQNVNTSTGVAIANSNWNDAQFGGAIMVKITGNYTPTVPVLLFLPSSFAFQAATIMNSEGN